MAETPLTSEEVPSVRSRSTSSGGTPPAANWMLPDNSASFIAAPPARVA